MQSHSSQTLGTHTHTHTYTHRKPCWIPVKVSWGCYMFAVHFSPIKMRHWKFTGLSVAQWGHINTLVHQYVRALTHTLQMLTLSDACYHLEPGVWFSHLRCQDQAPVGSPCLPCVCVWCVACTFLTLVSSLSSDISQHINHHWHMFIYEA